MADAAATNTETSTTETATLPAADTGSTADIAESTALGGAGESADVDAGAAREAEAGAEVPDAYELTATDGATIDPEDVATATPVFKELGLSNEQANKLMPVAAQFAQRVADRLGREQLAQVSAWRKERFDEARNDTEIGGAKWDETLAHAAKALDAFGAPKGSPFRNALDESGWGNHRDFIAMFAKIGRAVGEDGDFVRGDAGAKVETNPARILYPNETPKGA